MKKAARVSVIVLLVGAIVVVLAGAGGIWLLGLVTWEHHTGYFGPAFSLDGRAVYAIVRETTGFTWGFGWEFFTPPAYACAVSDRIALVRIDAQTGRVAELEQWPPTPVARRVIREYRGRVFNTMSAAVRPSADGTVRYGVELAIPKIPSSEIHGLGGTWADTSASRSRGEWQRAPVPPVGVSLGEGDAILKAYCDLEDLGYVRQSPRMMADRVDPGDAASSSLPLFEIAEPEVASGILPAGIWSAATANSSCGFRGGTYRVEIRSY